jgi:Mg2+/Co2+ transporter CorB
VLDLGELEVSDVMIHRTSMRMLNADETPEANVRAVLESPYTRMPIWRGSTDNIIGIVHAKDVLRALADAANEPKRHRRGQDCPEAVVRARHDKRARPAQRLPAAQGPYRHRRGRVWRSGGLVTLEDILEEIVGEIADEHDTEVQGVRQEADGSIVVDGSVPVRDLNRALDWSLPDDEATTVAGLVIHESQTIPEEKQAFTFHGKRFIVMKRDRNRISRLRIRPADKLVAGLFQVFRYPAKLGVARRLGGRPTSGWPHPGLRPPRPWHATRCQARS